VYERGTHVTDLLDAHFYGADLDPALIWELEDHRGQPSGPTARSLPPAGVDAVGAQAPSVGRFPDS
jgi:hypothetical protein